MPFLLVRSMHVRVRPLAVSSEGVVMLQVLASPNDSHPWIRFMAFHVELGEVAKARAVAEKALQTIHFRQALLGVTGWLLTVRAGLFDIFLHESRQTLRCGVFAWGEGPLLVPLLPTLMGRYQNALLCG